ncbi:MAG: MBL fold metallo-hydrolase [Deltaproteobacteria bacterium]|nr:MBL fold metallo-hydrolase [Deltaproteobacteria bacterium]
MDTGAADAGASDAARGDAADLDAQSVPSDAGSRPFDAGPEPTAVLQPVPGELTILQLDLPPGITARLGEAAIIIGPAGSIALLDIGNSNHDDEVRSAIEALNTQALIPSRGFAARRPLQVEWVILTHLHGDHVGSFADLIATSGTPLEVTRGIVHRGFVDLGGGINSGDFETLCAALTGPLVALDRSLCVAATPAPCSYASLGGPHPSTSCPGLFHGDLATTRDDGNGAPAFIDLDGARIELAAAAAFVSNGSAAVPFAPFGYDDTNQENARSLVGLVSFGAFRYHFGGDLTGSGDATEPDVETHLVQVAGARLWDTRGVDVVHAHHHSRRTSSNATLVGALAPLDGRARAVVSGINAAYLGSPATEVLTAWTGGGRLGEGRYWVTRTAPGGASSASFPALEVADGPVIVQTLAGGAAYRIQAAGAPVRSRTYPALR